MENIPGPNVTQNSGQISEHETVADLKDHPPLRSIFNFDPPSTTAAASNVQDTLSTSEEPSRPQDMQNGDRHQEVSNDWQIPRSMATETKPESVKDQSESWPSVPPTESTWAVHGSGRLNFGASLDEFWKDFPPPNSYQNMNEAMSNLNVAGGDNPYASMGQFYPSYGNPGLGGWRDSGSYNIGGGGFWRRGTYGNYDGVLSRESSRDDLNSMVDLNFDFEDRFRVDRRKLELLIMGRFDPIRETAGDFFQRIGEETNTTIIWPSRIKIGMKLKKDDLVPPDPHVRIGGSSDAAVRTAKFLILEYLDTKTTRVTMKMDVSYTDHSHVIGKGGNTIRRVMSETNCHVHFPDSNRSNPNEKSNQVSIAGEMDGVEKARARVRELTPLIFSFDLPLMPSFDAIPDINDPYVRAIQDQYNIQVTIRQKQKNFHTTMVVVKGCEWEAARVKDATLQLIDHYCCSSGFVGSVGSGSSSGSVSADSVPVSMNMEISPIHHPVVLGKANINLKIIMQRTKTTILFPDACDPNIPPIRKGSVTITGNINNVYLARQLLVGSLPLVMMFDLPDHIEIDDGEVSKIQEDLDVGISIKPKQRQSNKSVMIKAQERNASGMYAARHKILGIEGDPIKADIPETYKLQAVTAQFISSLADVPDFHSQRSSVMPNQSGFAQQYLPGFQNIPPALLQSWGLAGGQGLANLAALGQTGPLNMAPQLQNLMFPSASAQSLYGQSLAPLLGANPTGMASAAPWMNSYPNFLPPNHPFLQEYAMRVLNHITHLQQLETQQKNEAGAAEKGFLDSINNETSGNYLPVDESPPVKGTSPRNSSPVHENIGNLTNQLAKLEDLNETEKFFELNSNSDNNSTIGNVALMRTSLGSSGVSSCGSSIMSQHPQMKTPIKSNFLDLCTNNNNNMNDEAQKTSPCEADSILNQLCDWRRAPGSEKNTTKIDYDDKKLLATKAVQSRLNGEARTPTPSWSGLGFSNSMPEAAIRENLESSNIESPCSTVNEKLKSSILFSNLMDGNEEVGSKRSSCKSFSSLPPTPSSADHLPRAPSSDVASPTPRDAQQFFRPNWFSNSSAFESMLPANAIETGQNRVLPSDDLPSLFARQGLGKYTDIFLRHEVDLATFATLTEQDLKEIGIQTFGARKKLLLLANKVKVAGAHQW